MEKEFELAIDALLENLGEKERKKEVMEFLNEYSDCAMKKLTNTRYKFWGIGSILGLIVHSNVFVVEMDLKRYETLHNYIKSCHRSRYDMFEFECNDKCIVAFD